MRRSTSLDPSSNPNFAPPRRGSATMRARRPRSCTRSAGGRARATGSRAQTDHVVDVRRVLDDDHVLALDAAVAESAIAESAVARGAARGIPGRPTRARSRAVPSRGPTSFLDNDTTVSIASVEAPALDEQRPRAQRARSSESRGRPLVVAVVVTVPLVVVHLAGTSSDRTPRDRRARGKAAHRGGRTDRRSGSARRRCAATGSRLAARRRVRPAARRPRCAPSRRSRPRT